MKNVTKRMVATKKASCVTDDDLEPPVLLGNITIKKENVIPFHGDVIFCASL